MQMHMTSCSMSIVQVESHIHPHEEKSWSVALLELCDVMMMTGSRAFTWVEVQ